MNEIDKTMLASHRIYCAIHTAPPYVKQMVFQCPQKDLKYYRAAAFSKEVTDLAIERHISLYVFDVELDVLFNALQPLDNLLDPDTESNN